MTDYLLLAVVSIAAAMGGWSAGRDRSFKQVARLASASVLGLSLLFLLTLLGPSSGANILAGLVLIGLGFVVVASIAALVATHRRRSDE